MLDFLLAETYLYCVLNKTFMPYQPAYIFLVKDYTGNIKELLEIMINQFYYNST